MISVDLYPISIPRQSANSTFTVRAGRSTNCSAEVTIEASFAKPEGMQTSVSPGPQNGLVFSGQTGTAQFTFSTLQGNTVPGIVDGSAFIYSVGGSCENKGVTPKTANPRLTVQ